MSYKVRLDIFEGPFDLLVYLIENAQMSIYDIKISEITTQYMAYLEKMRELNVAIAGEFMVLAAELLEIKSKMILPRTEAAVSGEIEEDPRSQLAEKLLEYKKFKTISRILEENQEEMAGVFEKPQEDISVYIDQPDEYLSLSIEEFSRAFQQFLHKKKKVDDIKKRYVRIERERASTESRIEHIKSLFNRDEDITKVNFQDTVCDINDNYDIVLSFTTVLEMIKEKYIDAEQEYLYGNIYLTEKNWEETSDDQQKDN